MEDKPEEISQTPKKSSNEYVYSRQTGFRIHSGSVVHLVNNNGKPEFKIGRTHSYGYNRKNGHRELIDLRVLFEQQVLETPELPESVIWILTAFDFYKRNNFVGLTCDELYNLLETYIENESIQSGLASLIKTNIIFFNKEENTLILNESIYKGES